MKILQRATEGVRKICLPQKESQDNIYNPTAHHISVKTEEGLRLYHLMTGEMLLLEKGDTWDNCRTELIAHRFLVPLGFNERQYAADIRVLIRMALMKKTIARFTIFTTTDCNARCFYCYEKGRSRIPMTKKTAHDVAAYIVQVSQGERVKLRWFGGEPLYNMEAIRIICGDLSKRGITFQSSMTSNGYYLTEPVIAEAKRDWNLKSVQITLDGTESVYNQTKVYIDGVENPYQRVLNNIESCLQAEIRVSIRLNTNQHNADDMLHLCHELAKLFGQQKLLNVYAAPIRNAKGQTTEEDKNAVLRIERLLIDKGLLHAGKLVNTFKLNRCMADDDGSVTILPDGRIGKCEHYSETETIGSIYSDEQDQAMIQSWKEQMDEQEECKTCPLYPRCIRLKKCEWEQFGCSEADRQLKIQRLKDQIAKFEP